MTASPTTWLIAGALILAMALNLALIIRSHRRDRAASRALQRRLTLSMQANQRSGE
jgi:hypothetical protein